METVWTQGVEVPALGFGTYPMKGGTCREACLKALQIGYRHIDTAQMYNNEGEVGRAIQQSPVDREEIFLVTKILRQNLRHADVLESVEKSLERLDVSRVDLLLIHSPSPSVPIQETIGAMNLLQDQDHVRHIGVSNFSVPQMDRAMEASRTPILTNQVKYNPFNRQDKLLRFCVERDVMLTAYTPLARGRVLGNPALESIGERHNKTAAQVTLRWLLQQPFVSAIPKSSTTQHMEENYDVFDFELSDAEMEKVFGIEGGMTPEIRTLMDL